MAITPRTLVKNPLLLVLVLAFAAVPAYMMLNCSKRSCSKQNVQKVRHVVVQTPPTITAAPTAKAGFLGIGIETMNHKLAAQQGLTAKRGVLVTKVMNGYSAKTSGFQKNDVVLSVNGKSVRTKCALKGLVSNNKAGNRIVVEVDRNGSKIKLFPTLSPSPLANNSCSPTKTKKNCRLPRK